MNTLNRLFDTIPSPALLREQARERADALPAFAVNAHIHLPPNFSAFNTTEQAVRLAAEQGIAVLGASNYYDYTVYTEFAERTKQQGIFPLFGIEIIVLIDALVEAGVKINDPGNPGKMYLCGKGITRFGTLDAEAQELLEAIRRRDSQRMAEMVERLARVFREAGLETELDEDGVKAQIVERHQVPEETVYLQERHIAQAFQEAIARHVPEPEQAELLARLFGVTVNATDAVAVQNAIRSHLMKAGKAAYVPETFVDFSHAYRLILALGGIPCYPVLADGVRPLCAFEADPAVLATELRKRNLFAAEFIPVRNTPEVLTHHAEVLRGSGCIVTAGTEHNTRDLLPLAPTCLNGVPIPETVAAIFREGVCVVAAHQYLTARGETGFVDAKGQPNAGYADMESRIAAFARLGATLLETYGAVPV